MKRISSISLAASLVCAITLSLFLFRAFAAEAQYELSQPITVDVAGQSVELPAGQAVTILGSPTPDSSGRIMVKFTLPNGSVSLAQIPASGIRPRSAATPAPAPAADATQPSGGMPPPAAAPEPASTPPPSAAAPEPAAAAPAEAAAAATPVAPPKPAATPFVLPPVSSTNPDFGPRVTVFNPSMPIADIASKVGQIGDNMGNVSSEFSPNRYAFLFMPGSYKLEIPVGFYTQILGLGQTPDQVEIDGIIRANTFLPDPPGNSTCTFWRAIENISFKGKELSWAVSQGTELRRVHVKGDLTLFVVAGTMGGWASGGFLADCKASGGISPGSQQQWCSRNSEFMKWGNAVWNLVSVGCPGAPTSFPTSTSIQKTPLIAEKPYLAVDNAGNFCVMNPIFRRDSEGTTWSAAANGGIQAPTAVTIPITRFYLAHEKDSAATINAALALGQNLILTPGVYHLETSINVTKPDTVVLGMGYPTLIPENGTQAIKVADVGGVRIAGVLLQAGSETKDTHIHSPALLQLGDAPSAVSHATDPSVIYDIFARVGGAAAGWADTMVTINSNDVIGDNAWLWRADHGTGATWNDAKCKHGLVVNGNNVTYYGLAVEHAQEYQTLWNGNGGHTYFYQSEIPYDVPSMDLWRPGSDAGYSSYKVADGVTTHEAWGLGVYSLFNVSPCVLANAIEAPTAAGVQFHHMVSINFGGKAGGKGGIAHVIDGVGQPALTGKDFSGGKFLGEWPGQ